MTRDLAGRHALVTGSGAGIGLAVAVGLLESGAAVSLNGRDEARLETIAADLRARFAGADIRVAPGDVGKADDVDAILERAGEVDILISGAATNIRSKTWAEYSDQEWLAHFETNLLGTVRLSRGMLPGMLARGRGRIVIISSDSGIAPTGLAPYAVTKTAQLAIARGLALETRGTEVTVNAVLPGPTTGEAFTDMLERDVAEGRAFDLDDAGRKFVSQVRPDSLLGRQTTPHEVASLILYLVSDNAIGVNGAAVRFEGGSIRSIL